MEDEDERVADFLDYSDVKIWNDFYAEKTVNEKFDWYTDDETVFQFLQAQLESKEDRGAAILVIGCGNSGLPEYLYSHGYKNVTGIDSSVNIIEKCLRRHKKFPGLQFLIGDTSRMDMLNDDYFDIIIDKGVLDCIFCGPRNTTELGRTCSEVSRILRPNGNYVCISYGAPQARLPYLDKPEYSWKIERYVIGAGPHHVYVCTKSGPETLEESATAQDSAVEEEEEEAVEEEEEEEEKAAVEVVAPQPPREEGKDERIRFTIKKVDG